MERGILAGLAAYRWAAWAWLAAVLVLSNDRLVQPALAYGLAGAALIVTAVATGALRRRRDVLLGAPFVVVEVLIAAALLVADGVAYPAGHAFSSEQSLAVTWPLAGVLAVALAGGALPAAMAGLLLGGARWVGAALNGVSAPSDDQVLSLVTTTVLYVVAGVVGGHLVSLLRRAEQQVTEARTREEVARTLHDGVLQTLAIIERRADDPALARLARDQERRLRDYIAGTTKPADDLGAALRAAASRFEEAFSGRATVVLADDLPPLPTQAIEAIAGAVGEALTNAGKHGAASTVTVFAEPDEPTGGVFCSVNDDGTGFDPATTTNGTGLRSSITGRIEEFGGRVEIESRPGGPTEVRLWVPT